jgi:hypothetical protein
MKIAEERFNDACEKGDIKEAKRIFKLTDLDLSNGDGMWAFRLCCLYGSLKVAKWLYKKARHVGGCVIDPDYYCFDCSCMCGHIKVAKWLYSLGDIDIHHDDNIAFRRTCERGHIEVAKWLCELCSGYYIEIEDGKIVKYCVSS